jgi:uncharacterized protein (DUF736 family)
MIIGKFTPAEDGYIGLIATLGIREEARIVTAKPGAAGAPDYVVLSDDGFVELGAAWKRESKAGKAYLSVKLDSAFLPAPINCALVEQQDEPVEFVLVWSRKKTSSEAPATE